MNNSKYVKKGQPGYDPLFKLRPFLDPLLKSFQKAYHPGREVSIDESMIGFKGRLSFLQYMPKKPTKWGMKAFVLADRKTDYTYIQLAIVYRYYMCIRARAYSTDMQIWSLAH